MSDNPHLPQELLDHVVDLLHDARDALKSCCLVSKSWIPRTRKHLFAHVWFSSPETLQSWKNTFPDPSTSPARYAETLSIYCPHAVTATDAKEGGWIPTFSRAVRFQMDIPWVGIDEPAVSLVPFHGFSPDLKSLRVIFSSFPLSCIFGLMDSFPLLEDLSVVTYDRFDSCDGFNGFPATVQPLRPPVFTGFLELLLGMGMGPIASRMLSLSGGLHFRGLKLLLNHRSDLSLTTALVESCGSTLEFLHVDCRIGDVTADSIDLSKATKLKDVTFTWDLNPKWIIATLRTLTSDHQGLRVISIDTLFILYGLNLVHVDTLGFRDAIGVATYSGWLELDHLLVELWRSHSTRTKVLYGVPPQMSLEEGRECIESLFPESLRNGTAKFISRGYEQFQVPEWFGEPLD